MKKTAILLIVLMVISVGFLCGCNEQNGTNNNQVKDKETDISEDMSRFIGEWRAVERTKAPVLTSLADYDECILTWYANGTYKDVQHRGGEPHTWWGNYSVKDEKLYIKPHDSKVETVYNYEFYNNGLSIKITNIKAPSYFLKLNSTSIPYGFRWNHVARFSGVSPYSGHTAYVPDFYIAGPKWKLNWSINTSDNEYMLYLWIYDYSGNDAIISIERDTFSFPEDISKNTSGTINIDEGYRYYRWDCWFNDYTYNEGGGLVEVIGSEWSFDVYEWSLH